MTFPATVLVAMDFSADGDRAAAVALDWAERSGGAIHLCHAVEALPGKVRPSALPLLTRYVEQAQHRAREKLDAWASRAKDRRIEATCHVLEGDLAPSLDELCGEVGADLAVVGTRGHSMWKRLLLGSSATAVVRQLPCSVLVVRGEGSPANPAHVVLGEPLAHEPGRARERALALCAETGAVLHVVHAIDLGIPYLSTLEVAVPTQEFSAAFAEARAGVEGIAEEATGIQVEPHLLSERPAEALCNVVTECGADLLVVGHHSQNAAERLLLGSVAERVVGRASCSVLVVR